MKCPVCQQEGISDIHVACPQCGSELTQFRLMEELDEQYREVLKQRVALEGEVTVTKKKAAGYQGKANRWLLIAGLLAVLSTWLWVCKRRPIVKNVQTVVQPDSLDYYRQELAGYRQRAPREIKYVIREKDVLEDIGELFYNDKTAGYHIGMDNNIDSKSERHRLTPGDTLTIRFW